MLHGCAARERERDAYDTHTHASQPRSTRERK